MGQVAGIVILPGPDLPSGLVILLNELIGFVVDVPCGVGTVGNCLNVAVIVASIIQRYTVGAVVDFVAQALDLAGVCAVGGIDVQRRQAVAAVPLMGRPVEGIVLLVPGQHIPGGDFAETVGGVVGGRGDWRPIPSKNLN